MTEFPFTSVMKRSRARLLHLFPMMMDWADGRIPVTLNSWAWDKAQSVKDWSLLRVWEVEQGSRCYLERLRQEVRGELHEAAGGHNCRVAKVQERHL